MKRALFAILFFGTGCAPTTTQFVVPSDPVEAWQVHLERARKALSAGHPSRAIDAVKAMRTTAVGDDAQRITSELTRVVRFLSGVQTKSAPLPDLDKHLDKSTLVALSHLRPGTEPGAYVHTRLALIKMHTGQISREELSRLVLRTRSPMFKAALRRVSGRLDQLERGYRDKTIGLLLPLSGPYRQLGIEANRAIGLAIGKQIKRGQIRLITRDTRGSADLAARHVDELVFDKGVVGILGPIGAVESTAAAARATELGVPIIPLTRREGSLGSTAIQTRTKASQEGAGLARYAMAELRAKRFAILVCDTPSDWATAAAFWDEVVKKGGEVVSAHVYPKSKAQYKSVVGRLVNQRRSSKRHSIEFDAVLIADSYSGVRRLLPFFPYWGVPIRTAPGRPGVQILGGSGWNHHGIIDQAEQLTNNAIFVARFFSDNSDRKISQFMTRFYGRFSEPPSPFEAEVYDAARFLSAALEKDNMGNRLGLMRSLRALEVFNGITGVLRFDKRGHVLKDPILLTIDRDLIRLRNSEAEEREIRGNR